MQRKRILSVITALAMCAMTTAPVFAEDGTGDVSADVIYAEGEMSDEGGEETPSDESMTEDTTDSAAVDVSDDITPDTGTSEGTVTDEETVDTDTADDTAADAVTDTDTAPAADDAEAEPAAEDTGDELLTDEQVFELPAWVQSWGPVSGVLTLQGQLPDTTYEDGVDKNLAYLAGIDKDAVKEIVITSGTKAGESANDMFGGMKELTEIEGLAYLNTSAVTDMTDMFIAIRNGLVTSDVMVYTNK